MRSICFQCGTAKPASGDPCPACRAVPRTADEVALSFMLSDMYASQEELAHSARHLRAGGRFTLTAEERDQLLLALKQLNRTGGAKPAANRAPAVPPPLPTPARPARQAAPPPSAQPPRRAPMPPARPPFSQRCAQWLTALFTSLLGRVALFGIVILAYMAMTHPFPSYWWATHIHTQEGWERFLSQHPSSEYSAEAREHVERFKSETFWQEKGRFGDPQVCKEYLRLFPGGSHVTEAMEVLRDTADMLWLTTVSTSRSEKEILDYIEANQRYTDMTKARARITALHNDAAWVLEQRNLYHCRRFITENPTHPRLAELEKLSIDLEVDQVANSQHGQLPPSQLFGQDGSSHITLEIENETQYTLTLLYSGVESKRLVVAPKAKNSITLLAGTYAVAASVNAVHVTSFYGRESYSGGGGNVRYFIETTSGSFTR